LRRLQVAQTGFSPVHLDFLRRQVSHACRERFIPCGMIPGTSWGDAVCRMGGISDRLYERPSSLDGGDSLNGEGRWAGMIAAVYRQGRAGRNKFYADAGAWS
jgi:hypothetical protein